MWYVFENTLKDALDVLHIHYFFTEVFYWLFTSYKVSRVIEKLQVQLWQTTSVFFTAAFSNICLESILEIINGKCTELIQHANKSTELFKNSYTEKAKLVKQEFTYCKRILRNIMRVTKEFYYRFSIENYKKQCQIVTLKKMAICDLVSNYCLKNLQ